MKQENPLPVGRGFKFSIKHLVRQHPKRFPRGWCSAQRIQNPMIAGGNHTTIPSCHGVALKSRPMTDEECGQ